MYINPESFMDSFPIPIHPPAVEDPQVEIHRGPWTAEPS